MVRRRDIFSHPLPIFWYVLAVLCNVTSLNFSFPSVLRYVFSTPTNDYLHCRGGGGGGGVSQSVSQLL